MTELQNRFHIELGVHRAGLMIPVMMAPRHYLASSFTVWIR
jgi:hypothetical protein